MAGCESLVFFQTFLYKPSCKQVIILFSSRSVRCIILVCGIDFNGV